MLIVNDILISEDIIRKEFVCNLDACKGACCWEGDAGAPLEPAEMEILDDAYEAVAPFLTDAGRMAIEAQGRYVKDKEGDVGTTLVNNGPCAYMTLDEKGVAQCGIEQAWKAGATTFRKPISCHLYPIRIKSNPELHFEAMNYDRWEICSAACELGKSLQVPVYKFVKDALIRKYGEAFYEELDAAAEYMATKKNQE